MRPYTITLLIAAAAFAQTAEREPRWRELNLAARLAVQAKDHAKLREVLLDLRPYVPGNPRLVYNLAAAEAMLRHPDAALQELNGLASMGLDYDLAADPDFSSLRGRPEFQAILDRIAAAKKPVTHSTLAFTLAEHDLIPEDIAYDPKTRRFFVSSARRGKIVTADGKAFAKSDLPVMGLRADPARRTLWASTGWLPQCDTCRAEDKDKTALLAFNLDSGALKQRIESPVKGVLGDLTGGWMLGRDELLKAPAGHSRRVLLLSDGHLNVGVIEPVTSDRIVAMFEAHGYETLGRHGDPLVQSSGEVVVLRRKGLTSRPATPNPPASAG
jgi:hypothetical protein